MAGTMKLLDVQEKALTSSHNRPGFAYYMEMGLGKTYTALTEFLALTQSKQATRLVVVCPNSFKAGWVDEIAKQGLELWPHIFESGSDHANEKFLKEQFDKPPVLIVNYEAIRKENTQDYIMQFIRGRAAMIVLD